MSTETQVRDGLGWVRSAQRLIGIGLLGVVLVGGNVMPFSGDYIWVWWCTIALFIVIEHLAFKQGVANGVMSVINARPEDLRALRQALSDLEEE